MWVAGGGAERPVAAGLQSLSVTSKGLPPHCAAVPHAGPQPLVICTVCVSNVCLRWKTGHRGQGPARRCIAVPAGQPWSWGVHGTSEQFRGHEG